MADQIGHPGQDDAGPGYPGHARRRLVLEAPKRAARSDFARDRARVLHSSALRRLGGKTQVVGPGSHDFVRTRLTHSLEVAQVGRELAMVLGCDPDVVDTACLAHDLGHPPFGHNGETALDHVMHAHGGFEGNAQTLRLLTRLEPKVHGPDARPAGLNLTRASLDAATKYPWRRGEGPGQSAKYGVYDDDLAVFEWLREGAPAGRRCVEAQVMDLADDVAYCVHDVEDAVVGGWLDPSRLADPEVVDQVEAQVRLWYVPDLADGEVAAAMKRLSNQPWWVHSFDGSRVSLARLKDATSQLIGRFSDAARSATHAHFGDGPLTRYAGEVVLERESRVEIETLKGVAAVFVMTREGRREEYHLQREVLIALCEALRHEAPDGLEAPFAADYAAATDDARRLRAVVDQVASLTDTSALEWALSFGLPTATVLRDLAAASPSAPGRWR